MKAFLHRLAFLFGRRKFDTYYPASQAKSETPLPPDISGQVREEAELIFSQIKAVAAAHTHFLAPEVRSRWMTSSVAREVEIGLEEQGYTVYMSWREAPDFHSEQNCQLVVTWERPTRR